MELPIKIEKSIQDQILDKMISKLEAKKIFEKSTLDLISSTDLTKATLVKELIKNPEIKDENTEA